MMSKLAQIASKDWRKLGGHTHLKDMLQGARVIEGENKHTPTEHKPQTDTSESNFPKKRRLNHHLSKTTFDWNPS
jgi:hypothetical protein